MLGWIFYNPGTGTNSGPAALNLDPSINQTRTLLKQAETNGYTARAASFREVLVHLLVLKGWNAVDREDWNSTRTIVLEIQALNPTHPEVLTLLLKLPENHPPNE